MLCISKNKQTNLTEYRVTTKPQVTNDNTKLPERPKVASPDKIKFDIWYDKQKRHIDAMYAALSKHLSNVVLYDQAIEVKSTMYDAFCKYLYETSNTTKSFFKLL